MAQTKQTAKRNASSAKSSSKGTSRKKAPAKKAPSQKEQLEQLAQLRTVLGGILLVISFVGFLDLFHVHGWLIEQYHKGFYWLLGYGASVLPVCLLVCGVLLLVRRRGHVRLQAICWAVLPLIFGAVRHVIKNPASYYSGLKNLGEMGLDGRPAVAEPGAGRRQSCSSLPGS